MKIINGDSLEKLKDLPENSVDSIVTDPPYGLSFMGKKWDYDVPGVELWKEAMRVLKPGGHLLSFAGSRTYHRMAVNIEDAGFEIRDQIMWVYGVGFPKSLNVGKSVNKLETKEWTNIYKAIDKIDQKSIIELWKTNSKNVNSVDTQLKKNQTEAGTCTPKSVFVQENVVENTNQEKLSASVGIVELSFSGHQATNTKIHTALENVEAEIKQSLKIVKSVEKPSQDQNLSLKEKTLCMSIFTVECDAKEWLRENTTVNHKVDEALKTLRGNQKYSSEEITSVLCVAIQNALKHTILSQSKTFQNLGTTSQMECVSAINVTIMEYTMEHLISNMVDILKSKAVDKLQGNERAFVGLNDGRSKYDGAERKHREKDNRLISTGKDNIEVTKGSSPYEGWGTALKPAHEPIVVARKPLSEKTIAENVLEWGTGGINIDGCRVETTDKLSIHKGNLFAGNSGIDTRENFECKGQELGRFPANFIHDGLETEWAKFFYCAKASKKDRNEGLEEKEYTMNSTPKRQVVDGVQQAVDYTTKKLTNRNVHPTVKPTQLMQYLVRLVTPKGGTVLDPFMGSGSTGKACKLEGFDFIGIELDEEYCKIAEARIIS